MRKRESRTYDDPAIISDPDGSYTGLPEDQSDVPVQDADDL